MSLNPCLMNSEELERFITDVFVGIGATKERSVTGIPLNDVLQEQMVTMRDELNLDYRFPFEN